MSLYQTLASIQQKLKAPKNQFNAFGQYHYRSCEDILEAIKPLLGTAILQVSDEIVQIGDRFYVKATASLMDEEKMFQVSAYAREELAKKGMDGSQITGSASSYARKYALNGLFLIDDTKDADTRDNSTEKENIKNIADVKGIMENKITNDQITQLKGKVKKDFLENIIGRTIKGLSDLTYDEADKVITEVNESGKE